MPDDIQTPSDPPVRVQPVVRRGWRHFHCFECEHRWKWPTRDALSPSGENCPRCDEWCHPYNGEIDATIPCDDMGNLTVPWNWTGQAPNVPDQRPPTGDVGLAEGAIGGSLHPVVGRAVK